MEPNQRGKVTIVYRTDASFGGTEPTLWGDDFFWKVVKRVGNFRALRTPVGLLFSNPTVLTLHL